MKQLFLLTVVCEQQLSQTDVQSLLVYKELLGQKPVQLVIENIQLRRVIAPSLPSIQQPIEHATNK